MLAQFYSKTWKNTHLVWGFFTFQCFVFFLIFAFSCLCFSSFPLLLDFLNPKHIYADESDNGTLFDQKRVRQRDADALNNGTRPVLHYKNSGFALFFGGQLARMGRRRDSSTMPEPRKLVGLVFRIFGLLGNRMSSFWGFVSFSPFFRVGTLKTLQK